MTTSLSPIYGNQYFEQVRTVTSKNEMPSFPESNVLYFIDPPNGFLDMQEKSITVPNGGLFISGHNLELSGMGSTSDGITLFIGDNAGNVFFKDMYVSVSGVGSEVYDITSATGQEAIEMVNFNYLNCTSLGTWNGFRQALESNTGRFGGRPSITLAGTWSGGYRATTTIVRDLDSDMTEPLFKAGAGFNMSSRFLTDMNADIPTNASIADFSGSNFNSPSLLQVRGGIFTRNGGQPNSGDNQFFPNLEPDDLVCEWRENQGLRSTFEGGTLILTSEAATEVNATSTFYDIEGTFTSSNLQHFDSPSNGQLRNLGSNPQEFTLKANLVMESEANNGIQVKLIKWSAADQQFEDLFIAKSTVNNLSGPRDVAICVIDYDVNLEQNDYVKIQVANTSGSNDITLEEDSFIRVGKR